MKCPNCSKFAALEMQEPEVNDLSFDAETKTATCEVRIVRNSECCMEEMKEYTFNLDVELPDELAEEINKINEASKKNEGHEAEFEIEEAGIEPLEEVGSRYKKSYYGFMLTAEISVLTPTKQRTAEEQAELDHLVEDYATTNASDKLRARRAELMAIGKPHRNVLGVVELTDKIAASEMDELN